MMRARIVRHSLLFLRRLFGRCSTFWRSTLPHGTRRNITTEPLPHWVLSRSLDNSARLKPRDRKRQVIRPSIRLRETPDADCRYLHDTLVVPMPYFAEPRILESVGSGNCGGLIPEILARSAVPGNASSKFR